MDGSIHKQLTWVLIGREFRFVAKEQQDKSTAHYSTLHWARVVKIFSVFLRGDHVVIVATSCGYGYMIAR
jgi:hypothetical protein